MARIDNNYFTYRETPTTENGTGTLVDIKGQTLKWNQIFPTQTVNYTGTGYTLTSNNDGKFVLTVTETTSQDSSINHAWLPRTTFKSGHKYILLGSDTVHGIDVYIKGYYVYMNRIWTAPSEMGANVNFMFNSLAPGTYNLYPMIFDLTAMGLDYITSVDEFKSLFPLDYYPFNSGSLIPFMGNGIKTVGKNQIKLSADALVSSQRIGINYLDNGAVFTANGTYSRAGYTCKTIKGQQYTLSFKGFSDANFGAVYISNDLDWNINYGRINLSGTETNNSLTFTANSELFFVGFYLTNIGTSGSMTIKDIQLELGSSATSYEPYTESVINLPISTYFPSGMKQAGNVYDEWTPTKATTRVGGILTLDGTNTWYRNYTRTNGDLVVYLRGDWKSYPNTEVADITANVPVTLANRQWSGTTTSLAINANGELCIAIEGKTTVSEVNAYLQSNPIYLTYALATPIETAISPELDLTFNIDKGGTEELLPSSLMNGSVDLGSLTWTLDNGAFRSTSGIPNMVQPQASVKGNIMCPMYRTTSQSAIYATANNMCVSGLSYTNNVLARNDSFTSTSDFKNAMQGVYLWYETTDSTPTTTPILCDILYRGLIPVSVTVYPLGAGTVEGAGQYRYGETVTLVAESSDGIYRFLRYEDENGDTLSTDSTYSFIAGE